MPFYTELDRMSAARKRRVARKLLELRQLFEEGRGLPGDSQYIAPIPPRSLNDNLLVASWNIREFDSASYGYRGAEPLMYIAEVMSRFDIIALQEVRRDTKVLKTLRRFLGPHWDYMVTDETGNYERLAIFFDQRKVRFTGVVGEVVLPDIDGQPVSQFARSPLLVGFQSGWFKFSLCTTHIVYGSAQADDPRRVREIQALAVYLKDKMLEYRKLHEQGKISHSEYENIILLGDFNIFSTEDATYAAFVDNGWDVTEGLFGAKTNTGRQKRSFDQIAYRNDAKNVQATGRSGVFDFFAVVYRADERAVYDAELKKMPKYASYTQDELTKKQRYYKTYWRTYQMSDHLPLWMELKINFSTEYLERRVPALSN